MFLSLSLFRGSETLPCPYMILVVDTPPTLERRVVAICQRTPSGPRIQCQSRGQPSTMHIMCGHAIRPVANYFGQLSVAPQTPSCAGVSFLFAVLRSIPRAKERVARRHASRKGTDWRSHGLAQRPRGRCDPDLPQYMVCGRTLLVLRARRVECRLLEFEHYVLAASIAGMSPNAWP